MNSPTNKTDKTNKANWENDISITNPSELQMRDQQRYEFRKRAYKLITGACLAMLIPLFFGMIFLGFALILAIIKAIATS